MHVIIKIGLALLSAIVATGVSPAQQAAEAALKPGSILPGTFHPFNINGEFGIQREADGSLKRDGRHHSLVSEYGLNPVVMIFADEKKMSGDKTLQEWLAKLDDVIAKDPDGILGGFVVFLTPDANGTVFEAELPEAQRTIKPEVLVQQIQKRHDLIARLEAVAKPKKDNVIVPLKNVIITYYPARGPKGYTLPDKADLTIVLYRRLRIAHIESFVAGKLTEADGKRMLTAVRELLKDQK